MKLKEITFVFENCECITIDGKYIGDFLVEDIRTSIQRIASNAINKMDVAHIFAIEIHKDADKARHPFDFETDDGSVFNRFTSWDDITSIEFELVDKYPEEGQELIIEHYNYFVHWVGEDNQENDAQKSYISKVGNLYIVIADGKDIEDFFDKEAIDDGEHMDFVCYMYGIGDKYSD
ncbi:MAG: hypothetical protein ACI4XN_13790 [Candidatus Kurthia intestinigallinarum]